MKYSATITDKRQLTIPAKIFRQAKLKEGEKVLVSHTNGSLVIEPMAKLINELAGSVELPKRFQGMNVDEIITQAKKEHFKRKA
jgi:AbrB family looped-hinge helix DNA binding protein